jgi:hypothetical protein
MLGYPYVLFYLVQVVGIEPTTDGWKPPILPLNYTCMVGTEGFEPSKMSESKSDALATSPYPYLAIEKGFEPLTNGVTVRRST